MAAPSRILGLAAGLLALGLSGPGCEEYGVDDTGSSSSDVNLVVAGFWTEQSGGGHAFHVLVENQGTEAAGPFQVRIYLQEEEPSAGYSGQGQESVSGLGADQTTDVVVNISGTTTGETAWVVVDGAATIDELYEDDNVSGPLAVADK